MNAVIAQFAVDLPASSRQVLIELWRELEEEVAVKDEKRLYGKLPRFGRTALAFIREMKKYKIESDPTWRERQRQRHVGLLSKMSIG